jgi:pimeloyl-ACP methyl ester carboxylesterase
MTAGSSPARAQEGGNLSRSPTREQTLSVWQDQVRIRVRSKGSGPAVVFFHGPWGLTWDPFLDELAQSFTVHAPEHPGTSPGWPEDVHHLDGLWDLVLCYEELLDKLGLEGADFVGHSFGAMIACEMAAAYPRRVRRTVLIDPLGFWRDDAPVVNWMLLNPRELIGHIFRDPDGEAARRMSAPSEDEEALMMARVQLVWAMGATGKFIWPLPDKGLKKRIHRVKARTLLIWGKEDRLVPPVYAEEFVRRIASARVETVDQAGHAPHLEHPRGVARLVRSFLDE